MNTCCENQATEVAPTEATATEVAYVQPQWRARRHESGVDLEIIVPGVKREDLKLESQAAQLVLEATRLQPENAGRLVHGAPAPEGYRLKLRVADNLDAGKLSAKLENGILRVSIPLVEAAQPKRIEVL
ncbi:Hsp20/alpha crystallin family protein [Haloferula sargassicola]|uniref:SHSP domain-containing protein n=1 Tax=Haloferula sargassicola TaxID=490096 RepID=A0ABP9US55_9BACT